MPGIVGVITGRPDDGRAEQQVQRMVRTMLHRPSYSHGTLSLPAEGCYLGWVTHPRTYADCNPIRSTDGQVAIVFAGEHFSHAGNGNGYKAGSAQELLSLYETKGERFVEDLNGFFSGVVVDRRRGAILLFNDRYGMGRVYCHEGKDTLTFASEAKAILSGTAEYASARRSWRRAVPRCRGRVQQSNAVRQRIAAASWIVLGSGSPVIDRQAPVLPPQYVGGAAPARADSLLRLAASDNGARAAIVFPGCGAEGLWL